RWRWAVISAAALIVLWVFLPWNWLVTDRLPDAGKLPSPQQRGAGGEGGETARPAHGSRLKAIAQKIGKLFHFQNLGSEFMPPLYEGDMLYMPTTFPGLSPTKARQIIQQTDKMIKSFPEVHHVFGKIGRAETATDPAPMDM